MKFCLGGRIHGHPNPPTPKFSFSSDFGHFILKMMEDAKFSSVSGKKGAEISSFLRGGGTSPADFSNAGDASPLSTPMLATQNPRESRISHHGMMNGNGNFPTETQRQLPKLHFQNQHPALKALCTEHEIHVDMFRNVIYSLFDSQGKEARFWPEIRKIG